MGKLQMRRSKAGERVPALPGSPAAVAPAAVRRSSTEPAAGPDLQRAALLGHNVQRLVSGRTAGRLQAKLTLGPVGDRYEQEADGVARQVMQQISSPRPALAASGGGAAAGTAQRAMPGLDDEDVKTKRLPGAVQRATPGLDDEDVKTKPLPGAVQRAMPGLDDEDVKTKRLPGAVQRAGGMGAEGGPLGSDIEKSIDGARSGGRSLGSEVRAQMEPAFGADFSGVRVHSDAKADGLNRSLQARAFTTGQDIFFRGGEYNPKSSGGQELLAHELTHVVQQNGGAVAKKPEEPGGGDGN